VRLHRASRKNASRSIIDIDSVTELSVTRKSLKPWAVLGISRANYFRRKAAGTLPTIRTPIAIIRANTLDLDDGIDFRKFGITAIRVMSGTDVLRAWVTAGVEAAPQP
jgi:hypothetical protein